MNRLPNPSILQCNCSHEWERQGHVVSDRRHVVSRECGERV